MKRLMRKDINYGNLILVNSENRFRDKSLQLIPIDKSYLETYEKSPVYVNKDMNDALLKLIEDINGRKKIIAVSGFRSEEEQNRIFEDSVKQNGIDFTKKYVARPGRSEHQTGLAIDLGEMVEDIDFICPSFPDEGICKSFKELAAKHGFIMRYKKDKEHITGIAEEKWHFRYVGKPHAEIMTEKNLCLEEYIDFLREFKFKENKLIITNGKSKIDIFFIHREDDFNDITLEQNTKYDISGNNVDGFIVTVFKN